MTLLLNNVSKKSQGHEVSETPGEELVLRRPQTRRVKAETIKLSGVSVRHLRSTFEKQMENIYPFAGIINNHSKMDLTGSSGELKCQGPARVASERVQETSSLRKERIVILFLSHWKRSAYAISNKSKKKPEQDMKQPTERPKSPQESHLDLFELFKQQSTIRAMIQNWRGSKRPTRQIQKSSAPFSPEQFVPPVNGVAMPYDSLTLDLFMLGYFHILEQDLPPEERKMRHLLCFEVFDHLAQFSWERVRDFHRAVLQDIQDGRRKWTDGFEDLKLQFFGSKDKTSRSVMRDPRDRRDQTSNNEICEYIDRSFAFWKQKEAEMFQFGR